MEVEHVRARRTKKKKQDMTLLGKMVTEGNERSDELAKDGAMLDGGEMPQIRASTVQQKKRGGFRAVRSFHCLVEEWYDCEELKPKPKDKWTYLWRGRWRPRSIARKEQ